MKLRTVFALHLPFLLFSGVYGSLFPRWVLRMYGLPANEAAIWMTRALGGCILGMAVLVRHCRRSHDAEVRRTLATALCLWQVVNVWATWEVRRGGTVNAFGTYTLVLSVLWAAAYGFFLLVRRQDM